jgi:glycosyltransferase involved in cell wall biosynthesis
MRILVINQSDVDGGAARATYRLASKFFEMGFDIKMLVMRKLGNDAWVLGPLNFTLNIISRLFPRIELLAQKLVGINTHFSWSVNLFNNPLLDKNFVNSFDVIHLNWVGKNMLPLSWIHNFQKPVVWTLHDSWAFTGGCHIPSGCRHFEKTCGQCPQLSINNRFIDISNKIWLKKNTVYPAVQFHFVAPSHSMANDARSSSLLKDFPISVIPNGLDTSLYIPQEKVESRKALGLPVERKIILFGAMHADSDINKGMDLLIESLNILCKDDKEFAKKNLLVIFGTENQSLADKFPLPIISMGIIRNENTLALIYSAADLTVVPSRSESFGQVASESLSCATPVIAFDTTGLKDIVDHMETGYLARKFEAVDMALGIKLIVEDSDLQLKMSSVARERSIARFDINLTTRMYLELFEKLTESTLE